MFEPQDPRAFDVRDPGRSERRDATHTDPRDVFAQGLWLPRGREREHVCVHHHEYHLRGSEVRALATTGAFRVVPASELRDDQGRPGDLWHGDLDRLRSADLIRAVAPSDRKHPTTLVALTERGREILEYHRDPDREPAQVFYASRVKTRELSHDSRLFQAYLRSAGRLHAQGARIDRVVLDDELKREYQQFLQEGNRERADGDGRPTRTREEIDEWAHAHSLPVLNDHVQFPDLRIEYEALDGRRDVEDIEVWTPHYRGAHAAAKGRSGFTGYRTGGGGRVGGHASRGGRGRPFDPDVAAEFLE
jgi:hypothetical protein